MFGFLKKKLKSAVEAFTKKAEEEVKEEEVLDEKVIEEASKSDEELLKVVEEHVEEIPPTREEIAVHQAESVEESLASSSKILESTEEAKDLRTESSEEDALDKSDDEGDRGSGEENEKEPEQKTEPELEEETKPEEKVEEKIEEKIEQDIEEKPKEEPEPEPKKKPEEPEEPGEVEEQKEPEELEDGEGSEEQEKKGFFSKLKESFTKKELSEEEFENIFWDLELAMLENNVAIEVIEKIKKDLKETLTSGKVSRLGVDELVRATLKKSLLELFDVPSFDLVERIKKSKKRPFVIAFIGVNGSGKTTTLAKIANLLLTNGLRVVLAASDTFRAAAIDQLEAHARNLGIKLISQGYGADPAAVAYDAIEHAKAKNIDVVMIDTAGRLHSNTNLMKELEKVIRVAKPDLKIFIGESITGNDCVEQAKKFDELVGIDAIILSKADVDDKGGAAISVSYVTGKPILYLGIGQNYGDLKKFDKYELLDNLGL